MILLLLNVILHFNSNYSSSNVLPYFCRGKKKFPFMWLKSANCWPCRVTDRVVVGSGRQQQCTETSTQVRHRPAARSARATQQPVRHAGSQSVSQGGASSCSNAARAERIGRGSEEKKKSLSGREEGETLKRNPHLTWELIENHRHFFISFFFCSFT